jgi:hypothetical protein
MGNPVQLASAKEIELAVGATTLPEIYAKKGMDCRKAFIAGAHALGLSDDTNGTALQKYQAMVRSRIFTTKGNPPLIEADLEERELGLTPKPQPNQNPNGAPNAEQEVANAA